MAFLSWLLDRLKEPSTWYSIITMLTTAGVNIDPDLAQPIISTGVGAASIILFVTKEKK
jgi:hypothetical protein